MKRRTLTVFAPCALALSAAAALLAGEPAPRAPAATPPVAATSAAADPRVELLKKLPGVKLEDLRATPLAGIYEVRIGADVQYVSSDAKYLMRGELFRMNDEGKYENLTDDREREIRRSLLAAIPESQMLIYGPQNPRYTVTVFTDVDCSWCRKLHSQIAEYNKLGVRVRYLFYPRSGPDTESWYKAEQVWCSANRQDAFNHAMKGEQRDVKSCPQAPIRRMYELGRTLGVDATPGLLFSDGELHLSYVEPAKLVKYLQASSR